MSIDSSIELSCNCTMKTDISLNYEFKLSSASIWIVKKYVELEKQLEDHLNTYHLAHSIDGLYRFLWDYFADWYVEYLKTDPTQIPFAKDLFRQYIVTLSPYCPFETEVLWRQFFGESQLLAMTEKDMNWSREIFKQIDNLEKSSEFEIVIDFISRVRSLRGLFAIDPVTRLEIQTENTILSQYLDFIALTGRCSLVSSHPKSYRIQTSHYEFSVDILNYITDITFEMNRTNKIIISLEKQISALNTQLSNQKFIENADPDTVIEKQNQLTERAREIKEQTDKLTTLQNTQLIGG